jgi:amidase
MPPVAHGALSPSAFEQTFQKLVVALNLNFLLRLPGVVDKSVGQVYKFMAFAPLANITGQPSMSVPLDWNDEGLPIGSMLTGRWGDEATLFRLAAQLETAHPWAHRRPPIHSDTTP